jgi:hypothetical protein
VTERRAADLAARFGLPGGRFGETRSTAAKVTYAESQREVTVYRGSGGVRYRDRARWQVDHGGDLELADEEAVDLATILLSVRVVSPRVGVRRHSAVASSRR